MTNEPTIADALIRSIAEIIDHPSVYMGGPSRNAMRIASNIVEHHRADFTPADDQAATIARLTAELEEMTGKNILNETALRLQKTARAKAEAKLAEVTAELEAIKGRKVAAIINGDGPMTLQKSTVRKLVEERDAARAAGTFAQGIEAAANLLQEVSETWDCGHNEARLCDCAGRAEQWGIASDEVRALSPAPQADPVREAAHVRIAELEAALRPFADAWKIATATGLRSASYLCAIASNDLAAVSFSRASAAIAQKEPSHD